MDLNLEQFASSMGMTANQLVQSLGDGNGAPLHYNSTSPIFPSPTNTPPSPSSPTNPELQTLVGVLTTMLSLQQSPGLASLLSSIGTVEAPLQSASVTQSHLPSQGVLSPTRPKVSPPRSRKATQSDFLAPTARPPKRPHGKTDDGVFLRPYSPVMKSPATWTGTKVPSVTAPTTGPINGPINGFNPTFAELRDARRARETPSTSKTQRMLTDADIVSILTEGLTGGIRRSIIQEEGAKFYEEKIVPYIDFKSTDPLVKMNEFGQDYIGGATLPHAKVSESHFSVYQNSNLGILILRGGNGCAPMQQCGPRSPPLTPAERELNTLRKLVFWYTIVLRKEKTDEQTIRYLAFPPRREAQDDTNFSSAIHCFKSAYARLGVQVAVKLTGHPLETKFRMLKIVPTLNLQG